MKWLKDNWTLKLLALVLAGGLWMVLHFRSPEPVVSMPSLGWPAFGGVAR